MVASCTLRAWGLIYKISYDNLSPTLSQLLICIRAQQATAYLNMLMTPTWLCPQRTQARDAKKSSKIGVWAAQNNLKLNSGKTKEMVITRRGKRGKSANLPAACPGIERVSSICILGVTVNDQLSAADHVNSLLASSKSLL